MSAWIIDTETTSTKNTSQVIEFAYQTYDFGSESEPFGFYARYGHTDPIALGALATHHILPSELEDLPLFNSAEIDWPEYLIGHNVDFDWKMCGKPAAKRICTLALARAALPDLDTHSLSGLMYYFLGADAETRDILRNAHSAGVDVDITSRVLNALLSEHYPDVASLEELYLTCEEVRIPKKMSFGKFKGQPISAVDNGWRNWYRRQDDIDEYVLRAFDRYPYRG